MASAMIPTTTLAVVGTVEIVVAFSQNMTFALSANVLIVMLILTSTTSASPRFNHPVKL